MNRIDWPQWWNGYNAACEALNRLPGPLVRPTAQRVLTTRRDEDDEPNYDAGFRTALRDALVTR